MKIRQYSIIFIFLSACVALSLISYLGHFNNFGDEQSIQPKAPVHDTIEESFFKNAIYYSVEDTFPIMELESSELSISNTDGIVIGFDPIGLIYRYEKITHAPLDPIHFQAKNSRALLKTKELFLENEVVINMKNSNIHGQKVSILSGGDIINANNDVKTLDIIEKTGDEIQVDSNTATYQHKLGMIEYRGNVSGLIKRKKIYEENISFKTDLMTFNSASSLLQMQGNVALKKANLDASSHRGNIFLENYNKKLKYYALYDDIRLVEKLVGKGKTQIRKAFSEKLEGFMSEKRIVLTGLPKVFQERDVIKGNRITVRENVETVEVDDANTNITIKKD